MSTDIPPRSGSKRPSAKRPATASSVPPRGGAPKKGTQSTFRARKRRQQRLLAGLAIAVVVVVVGVIIGIKAGGGGSNGSGIDTRTPVSSATLASVTSVPLAQMAAAEQHLTINKPQLLQGAPTLTSGGKPEVLYIGAEYCPYCAGERWAMVLALSQFGTFSNLHSITSSPTDSVASVPTFSFYGATYSSPYLTFTPVETQTVSGKKLDTLTSAQQALITKYDGPPYVPAANAGGIPFLYMGGYSVQDGISFDDSPMQHQSFSSMASQVSQVSSPTAGYIAATAGAIISNLCHLTGGKSLNGNAACKAFATPITTTPGS